MALLKSLAPTTVLANTLCHDTIKVVRAHEHEELAAFADDAKRPEIPRRRASGATKTRSASTARATN